jgi:acyl-CoA thioester hydrolase
MTKAGGPGAPFEWRMIAPDTDVDENCHVSNVAYIRWIQDAARAHSEAIGWTKERYQATGCFFLIRRHEVDYLRPAMGGDDIKIVTWVDEFRPASATRVTRILRAKDDVELVTARTDWVFVSIEGSRPKRIPADVVSAFSGAPLVTTAA